MRTASLPPEGLLFRVWVIACCRWEHGVQGQLDATGKQRSHAGHLHEALLVEAAVGQRRQLAVHLVHARVGRPLADEDLDRLEHLGHGEVLDRAGEDALLAGAGGGVGLRGPRDVADAAGAPHGWRGARMTLRGAGARTSAVGRGARRAGAETRSGRHTRQGHRETERYKTCTCSIRALPTTASFRTVRYQLMNAWSDAQIRMFVKHKDQMHCAPVIRACECGEQRCREGASEQSRAARPCQQAVAS